jgi:two-component system, cell cycle response regulator DivK
MNILVIEDNEQNLYMVTFLLTARGHSVTGARTGQEGLVLAELQAFDIILLDIQLPEMDGYTVAHKLRQMPSCAQLPIVAVTSYALADDRDKALEAGCTAYITKPLDIQRFCRDIEALVHAGIPLA